MKPVEIKSAMLIVSMFLLSGCGNLSSTQGCQVRDPDINQQYSGACKNGLAEGFGKATGRDVYVGSFVGGEPDGQGEYRWIGESRWKGDVYKGEWKQGDRTLGTYMFSSGVIYIGSFKGAMHHGLGVMAIPEKLKEELKVDTSRESVYRRDGYYVIEGVWYENKIALYCRLADCEKKINELK